MSDHPVAIYAFLERLNIKRIVGIHELNDEERLAFEYCRAKKFVITSAGWCIDTETRKEQPTGRTHVYFADAGREAFAEWKLRLAQEEANGFMSPADLAIKHRVKQDALSARLRRAKKRNQIKFSDYVKKDIRLRNEPKYLYRESAVLPIIKDMPRLTT